MKKFFVILCALVALLPYSVASKNISVEAESYLPETIQYEYSGKSVLLPVWPSQGGESYSVEVKDEAGNVLAENVLSYAFGMGNYTLEYTVYSNGAVADPIARHTVAVTVKDTTPPTVSVSGSYKKTYTVGEKITVFNAIGNDLCEGEVECSVVITRNGTRVIPKDGQIELKEGVYTLTYTAKDSKNNSGTREYTFTVSSSGEQPQKEKKGCKSSVLSSGTALLSIVSVGAIWIKRRKRK